MERTPNLLIVILTLSIFPIFNSHGFAYFQSDKSKLEDQFNSALEEYNDGQFELAFNNFLSCAELGNIKAGFYVGEM